ncbi:DUF2079 domain-containing protein [Fluviispira sanaruensis]|uniref:DUF2079 domain-containing protein n=1 Tax=Fluviispira sanaruensis TaxID=2493639 RepID=UPI00102E2CF2|nr:DUF2079 domain-containing protein [Fluviispira sanaruensis]
MNIEFRAFLNKEKFSLIGVVIVSLLVIFAIVPNSFAISLVGVIFSLLWLLFRNSERNIFSEIGDKRFLISFFGFASLVTIAACLHAYARTHSPGFDLSWFAQAISTVKFGELLRTTSELRYHYLLTHWEPILFTAVPLTYIFSGAVSIVLWQAIALLLGSLAAWKISSFLFLNSRLPVLRYLTTILFILSWINVNPIMFDAHPPVFGTLLFIPWIFYCIISDKSKYISFILLLFLVQCSEIFFAIAPVYFIYYILKEKISIPRILISVVLYFVGFLLIGSFQRYFGPWLTGEAFRFGDRFANVGGDGIGILQTFFRDPLLVISQLFTIDKVKTFLKIFFYCGPFAFLAVFSKKYRLIAICVSFGCLAYFIQAGLSGGMMISTNTHYISSLGTQWWILTVLGIYYLSNEFDTKNILLHKSVNFIFSNKKIIPFFMILFFLNTSEWRKSLLYPIRGIIERDKVNKEVRNFLTSIPREKGVMLNGTEWLCPLAANERKWLLCEGIPENVLRQMPLDVVVANKDRLKNTYESFSAQFKEMGNGKIIKALIAQEANAVGWEKVGDYQQADLLYSSRKTIYYYTIWKKK